LRFKKFNNFIVTLQQGKIKKKIKAIRRNTIPVKVSEFNSYIRGLHNYFEVATQVNKAFKRIGLSLKPSYLQQVKG